MHLFGEFAENTLVCLSRAEFSQSSAIRTLNFEKGGDRRLFQSSFFVLRRFFKNDHIAFASSFHRRFRFHLLAFARFCDSI